MGQCIVCIGSNYNRNENMNLARKTLAELFPSIRFVPEQETTPLNFNNPSLFSNQLALFTTSLEADSVKQALKNIEQLAGRLPEDKKAEKVCLDIDLLAYNDQILKPEDWQREYIQQQLSILHDPFFTK